MLSFFRRTSLVAAVLIASACDGSDKNPTGLLPASTQLNTGGADRFVQDTLYVHGAVNMMPVGLKGVDTVSAEEYRVKEQGEQRV